MTTPQLPEPHRAQRRRAWPLAVAVGAAVAVGITGAAYVLRGGDESATAAQVESAPTTPAPTPTDASGSPATPGPLAPGRVYTYDNGGMTTTVLQYKQPAGAGPDLKKGEVLGGIEVKTCVLAHADQARPVSVAPWSLEWSDGTVAEEKWSGVISSEYPYTFKTVNPGKCVRGWIVFTVPAKAKPTVAVYEGDANKGRPAEWKLS